ncbi:MAG: LysR family transcriptional regulator [Oenococcus sp.]|uniref:LysR family transcriptional regulator n=1 Tax=Oenococcus sp. TaxID=1979414 RepID=UPI0039EB68D4
MEIHDLKILQTVAHFKSFSKAADSLGYVQPNITSRIQKLENELHVSLFRRTNHGVEILPAGTVLLKYADRILLLMDQIEKNFKKTEHLSIGATPSLSTQLFPTIMQNAQHFFPNLSIDLQTQTKDHLYDYLQNQILDGVFVNGDLIPQDFSSVYSYTEKLFLVSSRKKFVKNDKQIAVMNKNKSCPFRQTLLHYLKSTNQAINLIEYDGLGPVIKSIQDTNSITVLPQSLISSNMKRTVLPKIMNTIQVHFVIDKNNIKKESIKKLINQLTQSLSSKS